MTREKSDEQAHTLKITSPRLEKDEFRLTPSARPGRRDARELDPRSYSSSTRAIHDPESDVAEKTEQVGLVDSVAATDGGDEADD